MAEEMAWLFIVMKLKIIFNFICQGSAPLFTHEGHPDFLPPKEGGRNRWAIEVSTSLSLPPPERKEPQANWRG